jgi:predicted RNase H-like nuclease (RuvC/YqgF family)
MDRAPFYNALEIVLNYLTLRGYEQSEAGERARRHILKVCIDRGERRALMLANLAIAEIEEEVKIEEERTTVVIGDFYRHHG